MSANSAETVKSKQHFLKLDGINICFPHEPYQVQIEYLKKLLECLRTGQNGLLESPTGTGKTLSLLCGALAWLEHQRACVQLALMGIERNKNDEPLKSDYQKNLSHQLMTAVHGQSEVTSSSFGFASTKIIYSSRTHSQLSQVVQELKKTSYNHVKSVVLGSRDQLCLLPEVASLENNMAKLHACRAKVKKRTCPFYLNVEEKVPNEPDFTEASVLDIEDLVKLGTKHRCCPYYSAKEIKKKADVIFAPYNYLIDPKTRKAQSIELQNNVVIFDEAHNIENVCEESMSFRIRSKDLAFSISEVTKLMEKFSNANKPDAMDYSSPVDIDISIDDLASLKVMFTEIENILDQVASTASHDKSIIKNGGYIFEILNKAGLNVNTVGNVETVIEQVVQYFTQSPSFLGNKNPGLQKFSEMLQIVFSLSKNDGKKTNSSQNSSSKFDNHYKICVKEDTSSNNPPKYQDYWSSAKSSTSNANKRSWTLDCWCLSPERSMVDLMNQGVHCMILTSGTLSPLKSFQAELGIPFPIHLENPHIINPDQVLIAIVAQGPDGTTLTSSYGNRDNPIYVKSLGMALNNFCTSVPKGMLVFFPSYTVMTGCIDKWKATPLFSSLAAKKTVFVEPRSKDSFNDCMDQYYNIIEDQSSKGAILFGVCRGKVSEGLDFANDHARAVIITGIPFAPFFDERVKLKKQYLSENKNKGLSGEDWYMLQAIRAVNQAIGRVIRHKNDFGVVLLCDNRFARKDYISQLSMWVRGHVKSFNTFGLLQKSLIDFFKKQKNIIPTKLPLNSKNCLEDTTSVRCSFTSSQRSSLKVIKEKLSTDEEAKEIIEVYNCTSYSKTSSDSDKAKKIRKLSIFDAIHLDDKESQPSSISQEGSNINTKRNNSQEPECSQKQSSKKRKINIAAVDIFGTNAESEKSNVKTEVDKKKLAEEKQQNIKDFTIKIKEIYGKQRLLKLHACIKEAISKHDVNIFVQELVTLTTSMTNKKDIFNSVIFLLPSGMRQEFQERIKPILLQFERIETSQLGVNTAFQNSDSNHQCKKNASNGIKKNDFTEHKSKSGAVCPVCKNLVKFGKLAQICFHLCCTECWQKILKTTKKCPVCSIDIRKRHLKVTHTFAFAPVSSQNIF